MPARERPAVPRRRGFLAACLAFALFGAPAQGADPTASQVVDRVLDTDAWGASGAIVKARLVVKAASGAPREIAFTSKSRKAAGHLTKNLLRFSAPADLAGQAFLQVEKGDGDDDRFLWIPELKKAKRIAGASRKATFSGTDFTYADMDRRDLREGTAKLLGTEKLGKIECYHVDVTPKGESPYAHIEVWARTTDFVPMKTVGFGSNGQALRTIESKEARKIDGRLFITRTLATNHAENRTTELVLDEVKPTDAIPEDEFTLRALEKE